MWDHAHLRVRPFKYGELYGSRRVTVEEALAELKWLPNTALPFELVERVIAASAYDASPNPSTDYYGLAVDGVMEHFVRSLDPDFPATRAWVASLLLVSRRIRDLVLPILYETVSLTRSNLRHILQTPSSLFRNHTRYLLSFATLMRRGSEEEFKALKHVLMRFVQVQGFYGSAAEFNVMARIALPFQPPFVILSTPGSFVDMCKGLTVTPESTGHARANPTPLACTRYLHLVLDGDSRVKTFSLSPSEISSLALQHVSIAMQGKFVTTSNVLSFCRTIIRDAPAILEIPTLQTLLVRIPLRSREGLQVLQDFARSQPERSAKFMIEEVDLFVRRGPEPGSRRERDMIRLRGRQASSRTISASSPRDFSTDTEFEKAAESYPRAMFDPSFWQAGWSPPQRGRRILDEMAFRTT